MVQYALAVSLTGPQISREALDADRDRRAGDQWVPNLRILVLALATFAIGMGTYIITWLLGGIAEDLSVSVA
jgi:hypothetical protein